MEVPVPPRGCQRAVPCPQALDLQRPIDKRVYKGTQPTCHDFNQFTAGAETLPLLVGFSAGQVQYLDLAKKDSAGRLFNEEVRGHRGHQEPLGSPMGPPGTLGSPLGPARPPQGHREPFGTCRTSPGPPGTLGSPMSSLSRSNSLPQPGGGPQVSPRVPPVLSVGRFATLTLRDPRGAPEKEHKRYHSLGNISRGGGNAEKPPPGGGPGGSRGSLDMAKVLGTALCPRLHEVPLLEPLVCKKIAQERLTVLLFLEDCIVTACQEGLICTWARPGVSGLSSQNGGSPSGTVV
ncbi:dystrophia myotonica WD repeat-containing protein-like [Passer montanus]|uniref:dystrophia myotonica WD repeat-containing protein-like n=1 Tax=Passer montanus TaxID=9160 RepID=UPI001960E222|nr:dystrophia myotonica WD repeat-containing protein-like [Passer montanus]